MFVYVIIHSLQSYCNLPNYPQVLIQEDSTLLLSMNKKGMQQYLMCTVQQSPSYLQKYNLPSMIFNISIEGVLYEIDFKNISLIEMNTDDTFADIKSKSFEAHNTNILFNFSWNLNEMAYPYINDNGHGQINITGSDFRVNGLDFFQDIDCQGNLKYGISSIYFDSNILTVELYESKTSLFELIEKQIIIQLHMQLLDLMPQLMSDLIFTHMWVFENQQQNYQQYPKYPSLVKDDRFTSNMLVELNQLVFMKSGYIFASKNMSDQFINHQMINALPIVKNEKQIEYTIAKAALNNFLYIFHKYNDSYSNPSVFSVIDTPSIDLFKDHVTLNLIVFMQDEEFKKVSLKGAPKLRTEDDLTYLFFEFELEPENQEIISWVNEQIKDACYLIKNEVFSMNGFSVVIDADNDCVKIVGDIAACL
ncbi:BPI-like_protein [Hexamita inflata]|uniref:BPI-like protein n=1 Tax=Hexamita inflata TaxID=28002 RepID=A0AA86QFF3_9EUKA|nr:BPI-like protein [Hexamita inflata]